MLIFLSLNSMDILTHKKMVSFLILRNAEVANIMFLNAVIVPIHQKVQKCTDVDQIDKNPLMTKSTKSFWVLS